MIETTGDLPLRGQPGVPAGLMAYAQPRPDGTFALDRKGRPKTRRVQLRREHDEAVPLRPEGLLSDSQWSWAISAPRRWPTIIQRLGDQALQTALALARAGCVRLDHDYVNGAIQQPPRGWTPDPRLVHVQSTRRDTRRQVRSELERHASKLATELADDWPGVAAALTTPTTEARLAWFVNAAADLAAGKAHDSARAFVQVHAGHTKAREDLPRLLASAGFESAALTQLGISRSPYIGLAGPIRACLDSRVLDFTGFPGPHDLRLPPDQRITIEVTDPAASTLLVIENRQAAEAICDYYPHLPIVWCRGQPADRLLELINQAAAFVTQVAICPDADLGGIRIAARVYDHLPPEVNRSVVDIGVGEHIRGGAFSAHAEAQIARLAGRPDAIGHFAHACRTRGYAIEQEAPARGALRDLLADELPRQL
ncbi:hypothetical protein Nm8I071_56870 [Nonomuraea sp. TT08I-71]|nr:hypothetical protein Nm8I071_56870 [Nonomuraea sp. TT08I-71]